MNRLIPHIQYLLRHHDCLVIPGWGAFVVQSQGAEIKDNTVSPPKRSVVFNSELGHNDGLLATSISRKEDIGYQAAVKIVADSVDLMKSLFELTGSFQIPRVGTFKKSPSGKMIFHPDTENPIANTEFYGFVTLDLPVEEKTDGDFESNDTGTVIRSLKRAVTWAAAIVIIFILGVTLTTPVVFDHGVHYQASVVNTNKIAQSPVIANNTLSLPPINLPSDESIENQADIDGGSDVAGQLIEQTAVNSMVDAKPVRLNVDDRYFLIIASFETRRGAEKWIAKQEGEKLGILEYDGRCRVFAASANSFKDVRTKLDDKNFLEKHPDAWVFPK